MVRLVAGDELHVRATKGSKSRTIRGFPGVCAPLWRAIRDDLPWILDPYERVVRELRSASDRAGIWLPEDARSATHQFRHLYASWLASRGFSVAAIADELGHQTPASTPGYIHSWASIHNQPTNQ